MDADRPSPEVKRRRWSAVQHDISPLAKINKIH